MKFLEGILLSLGFHVLLVFLLTLSLALFPEKKNETLSFEILNQPHNLKSSKQFVRDHLLPEKLKSDTSNDPLRFLSERTQSTKEQTKAYISGLTKNRGGSSTNQKKLEQFLPDKISIPTPNQNTNEVDLGISTLSEDLSDVKIGTITALNTDRYLYYSYFSRSQELLWNEWAPLAQTVLDQPPASLRASIHRKFTTVIEVWFHPDGTLHSSHVMKPAGIAELDQIAIESFRRIQRIPNPPKEKIESDGLVRFKWSLTVEYNPKVLVNK